MRQRVRLTAEDIPLIRALLDSGMPVAEVARKFETSKQHIYSIRNGKNWGGGKMRDIRYLLTAWGNWSGSRIGTEYKAAWPLATASSDIRPMLSDADGETVDRAVGRLKYFDPLGYDIVVAYYKGKVSCQMIGDAMQPHRHRTYVSKVLERGEAYIAGRVAELLEAA